MVLAGEKPHVPGAVVALAGNGDRIVMANIEGVYVKDGAGKWETLEVPGLSRPDEITCIALDGDDEGLTGRVLWVATQSGISVRRDGVWYDFSPGRRWVASMVRLAGESGNRNIYVGSGFHLGTPGDDSQLFKPPITTIGFRKEMVILGNGARRLTMINESSVALFLFVDGFTVTDLLTDGGTVWTGTNGGLLWGRHLDSLSGRPWPTTRAQIAWRGTVFGNRDTRPFMFRWYQVGYNTAYVTDLAGNSSDL